MGVKRKEGQRVQEVSSLLVIKGLLIGWDGNGSPPSPGPQHLSIPLPLPHYTLHRAREGKSALGLGRTQKKGCDLG